MQKDNMYRMNLSNETKKELSCKVKDKFNLSIDDSNKFIEYYTLKDRRPENLNKDFKVSEIYYFECGCCAEDADISYGDKTISVCEIIKYIDSLIGK